MSYKYNVYSTCIQKMYVEVANTFLSPYISMIENVHIPFTKG